MQCPKSLDSIHEQIRDDVTLASVDPMLRDHLDRCRQCQDRLNRLIDEPSLAVAIRRARGKQISSVVVEKLDTVDAAFLVPLETTPFDQAIVSGDENDRLLDSTDDSSLLGVIGRYQIQTTLGRGGMSVVYAAWDPILHRRVAVKVLNTTERAKTWQRFVRESRAAARIEHDAVVPVYEVVEREHRAPAIVMPMMSPQSMQQQLGQLVGDPKRSAEIIARVARGLAEVHRHQQVHRDIKPGNILFDDQGNAKLADFGLVRRDEDEPLTEDNVLPGTPEYIAPELLVSGGAANYRSDIYQLGLTLYAALIGGPPYRGSVRSVLRQIMASPPPSPVRVARQTHGQSIDRDLETICLKAIDRDPASRYLTAQSLAEDLQRYLAGEMINARRPGFLARVIRWARRHHSRMTIIGVSTACFLILLLGYRAYLRKSDQFARRERQIAIQRKAELDQLAAATHRADVAQLKSDQVLSQSFSAVLASQQVRQPAWVDGKQLILDAVVGGLENNFAQMQLAPERYPNFGEMALSLGHLRRQAGNAVESIESYQIAIQDFRRRLADQPTETLWQHLANAYRGTGEAYFDRQAYDAAIEPLLQSEGISRQQLTLSDETLKWQLELAKTQSKLGLAFAHASDFESGELSLTAAAGGVQDILATERPERDLVGFENQVGDLAADLARGYASLKIYEQAVRFQRIAIVQAGIAGEDENSCLKRSDRLAELSTWLIKAGRIESAIGALRRSLLLLDRATEQSSSPERFRGRRAELQQRVKRINAHLATHH